MGWSGDARDGNRSFDSYFGTYPEANGIPAGCASRTRSTAVAWRRFTIRATKTMVGLMATALSRPISTEAGWTASDGAASSEQPVPAVKT